MGRCEREVQKERLVFVLFVVFLEKLNSELADRFGGVIAAVEFLGRERFVVESELAGGEVAVLIGDFVRAVETSPGDDVLGNSNVPLSRMVTAVASFSEVVRQQPRPGRKFLLRGIHADLLRVVTSHQRGPRRPAAGGVVELRISQAASCQSVEIGGLNLAAVTTEVGKPEIVGQNDDDIRFTVL